MLTYAKHPVSSLQIEHHPYLIKDELIKRAQENGITLAAYSSFGRQSFMELPVTFNKRAKDISLVFGFNVVKKAAQAHSRTLAPPHRFCCIGLRSAALL